MLKSPQLPTGYLGLDKPYTVRSSSSLSMKRAGPSRPGLTCRSSEMNPSYRKHPAEGMRLRLLRS